MAIKKHLIHCLLALCVGLLPVLNANAMSVEHSASGPMDCLDCDPVEMNMDKFCGDQECDSLTQSCASHTCVIYLPTSASFENVYIAQSGDPKRYVSDYRRRATDPIYRPPIA